MCVARCILLKLEDFFFHLLDVQDVCLCHQTSSRDKIFMYITAQISASVVAFRARRAGTVVLNDFFIRSAHSSLPPAPSAQFPSSLICSRVGFIQCEASTSY